MRAAAPFGKVMEAFLVASIAAPLLGGAIMWFLSTYETAARPAAPLIILFYALIFGFPFAFGHALVLGLPIYLWLERRYPLRWWNAAGAGALIGVAPTLLWIGPGLAWEGMTVLLTMGASGAGGGLVFRAALQDLMRAP